MLPFHVVLKFWTTHEKKKQRRGELWPVMLIEIRLPLTLKTLVPQIHTKLCWWNCLIKKSNLLLLAHNHIPLETVHDVLLVWFFLKDFLPALSHRALLTSVTSWPQPVHLFTVMTRVSVALCKHFKSHRPHCPAGTCVCGLWQWSQIESYSPKLLKALSSCSISQHTQHKQNVSVKPLPFFLYSRGTIWCVYT